MSSVFASIWGFIGYANDNALDKNDNKTEPSADEFVIIPNRHEEEQAIISSVFNFGYEFANKPKYDYLDGSTDRFDELAAEYSNTAEMKRERSRNYRFGSKFYSRDARSIRKQPLHNTNIKEITQKYNINKHALYKSRGKYQTRAKKIFRQSKSETVSLE